MGQKLNVILWLLVIALGLVGWWQWWQTREQLALSQNSAAIAQYNRQVLEFTSLLVNGVIGEQKEVDFETRLKLENSIRGIGDQDLLSQWRKFVDSADEETAQREVKNLLALLVSKISPQNGSN